MSRGAGDPRAVCADGLCSSTGIAGQKRQDARPAGRELGGRTPCSALRGNGVRTQLRLLMGICRGVIGVMQAAPQKRSGALAARTVFPRRDRRRFQTCVRGRTLAPQWMAPRRAGDRTIRRASPKRARRCRNGRGTLRRDAPGLGTSFSPHRGLGQTSTVSSAPAVIEAWKMLVVLDVAQRMHQSQPRLHRGTEGSSKPF